jgi:hypothetical protein
MNCSAAEKVLSPQGEFVGMDGDLHLRHARFIAPRDDEVAIDVRRERTWQSCFVSASSIPKKKQPFNALRILSV